MHRPTFLGRTVCCLSVGILLSFTSLPASAAESEEEAVPSSADEERRVTAYRAEGRYREAAALLQELVERQPTGRFYQQLGSVLQALGRSDEAAAALEKSMSMKPAPLEEASVHNMLGQVRTTQGRLADAEQCYRRALELREHAVGPEAIVTAVTLANLANVYLMQDRLADAEPLLQRAVTIHEKHPSEPTPAVATLHTLLGASAARRNDPAAEAHFQRALGYWERISAPQPQMAATWNRVAQWELTRKHYRQAEELFRKSRAVLEKLVGPVHGDVAMVIANLARTAGLQGRMREAESLYRESLAMEEKALGSDHPRLAQTLNNLAVFYLNHKHREEAGQALERACTIALARLSEYDPIRASIMQNLANVHFQNGRLDDAAQAYEQSLPYWERRHAGTVELASRLEELAAIQRKRREFAESEKLITRAMGIRVRLKLLAEKRRE